MCSFAECYSFCDCYFFLPPFFGEYIPNQTRADQFGSSLIQHHSVSPHTHTCKLTPWLRASPTRPKGSSITHWQAGPHPGQRERPGSSASSGIGTENPAFSSSPPPLAQPHPRSTRRSGRPAISVSPRPGRPGCYGPCPMPS